MRMMILLWLSLALFNINADKKYVYWGNFTFLVEGMKFVLSFMYLTLSIRDKNTIQLRLNVLDD